jgi:N-acetylglucosaminyldiphosphoundecaprenol N-acetyl-beta-D-mannosaminyltransferase
MQLRGLEWAFRLAIDPRRLARRYLLDSPQIVSLLLREGGAAVAKRRLAAMAIEPPLLSRSHPR